MLFVAASVAAPCTFTATVRSDGEPISGTPVLLVREERYTTLEEYRAITDESGRVGFSDLPEGWYRATAASTERVPGTMKSLQCISGQALAGDLELKAADAWFEGRLVDVSGKTLDGTVGIVDTDNRAVFTGHATVDVVDGAFRIGVISGHGYNLYGFSEGYHFGSTMLTQRPVAGERKELDIVMSLAARIGGVVMGPDGKPVPGAEVYRMPLSTDTATTDAKGRFVLQAAPGGLHRVSAIAGGLVGTAEVGEVREGEDQYAVAITLKAGRTVKGSVLDASRKGVGPTTVVWSATGTGLVVKVPVAADGTFVAEGVPYDWPRDPNVLSQPGGPQDNVIFFVHDNDRGAAATKVGLPPSETTIDVPFELRKDASVRR